MKAGSAYKRSLRQAAAAFEAAAGQLAADGRAASWEVLLARGRCLRKLGEQPHSWLALLAQACTAARRDGGALLPLYALHASRMRLLLGMPAAARWAGDGSAARHGCSDAPAQQQQSAEWTLLQAVGRYCFLRTTAVTLRCGSQEAGSQQPQPAESERAAGWQALLEDCCAAMRWCLEKDRNFHRATYRCVAAGRGHAAVGVMPSFALKCCSCSSDWLWICSIWICSVSARRVPPPTCALSAAPSLAGWPTRCSARAPRTRRWRCWRRCSAAPSKRLCLPCRPSMWVGLWRVPAGRAGYSVVWRMQPEPRLHSRSARFGHHGVPPNTI